MEFITQEEKLQGNSLTTATAGSTLYTGTINASQVACRPAMETTGPGKVPLGRFENGSPVGYRTTSDSGWYEVDWGFYPSKAGYVQSSFINQTNITIKQLIANIALKLQSLGYTRSSFGMSGKWCQWFVNYCVTQAGLASLNLNWINDQSAVTGWYAMNGNSSSSPSVGSIFYTRRNSDDVTHCGIVVSIGTGGSFDVIDGDYLGATSLAKRTMTTSDTGILGFVKPTGA